MEYDTYHKPWHKWAISVLGLIVLILMVVFLIKGCDTPAMASGTYRGDIIEGHTLDQWASTIRHAEGNANYGILSIKHQHESYKRLCENTVRHTYQRWLRSGKPGGFIDALQQRYVPIGASNDPKDLNRNWKHNVSYWLRKEG